MTRTRSQAGKLARTKGASFERLVVKLLEKAGIECRRNLAQTRGARQDGCDIEGTDWWIECTHGASCASWGALIAKHSRASAEADRRPVVVIYRRTGSRDVMAAWNMQTDHLMITTELGSWLRLRATHHPNYLPPPAERMCDLW